MIIHPNFQIVKPRIRTYDALLHKDYLDRTEAEHALCYFLLRNIGITCGYLFGVKVHPYQEIIIRTMLTKSFPMLVLTRGGGKTFCLAIYAALRSIVTPGCKVVIVGANRRQSRFVFAEITKMRTKREAGLFREVSDDPVDSPEESFMTVDSGNKQSRISAFPLAHGDKIRGARATHMFCDEFNIIPEDIFKKVLSPMGAVSNDPMEKVRRIAKEEKLIDAGVIKQEDAMEFSDNQIVISSSASYQFTFLYKKYKEYKDIIIDAVNATSNPHEQEKIVKEKVTRAKKYAIIQLSYRAIMEIAPGYMDESNVNDSKNSSSVDAFETEYGAQFVSDSNGFFPRTLIESRSLQMGEFPIIELKAKDNDIYIAAIDPSSGENLKNDYFGIMIGKLDPITKSITVVYASASSGKGWPHYVKLVRECIKKFKVKYIVMDKFGGGSQVQSLLSDVQFSALEGDAPILPLDKDDLTTFCSADNRILRMCVFDNQWIEKANINMKSMLDHRRMWFAAPAEGEKYKGTEAVLNEYDDSQNCIDMAKMQISMIVGSQTENGVTIFKMPDGLGAIKKKERVRKDLYTCSLLLTWGAMEYFQILEGVKTKEVHYMPIFNTT